MYVPRIIVTSGEPAGIGPDACVLLAQEDWPVDVIVACDATLLAQTAEMLHLPLKLIPYAPAASNAPSKSGVIKVLHVPTAKPVTAGGLDPRNAPYVIKLLELACDGCMNGEFAAMVTAPVQKSTLLEAGFLFTGHTEYLAARTRAALPVMLLLSGSLRVALVTTHLALADVPRAITRERVSATLRIVNFDLERQFSIAQPRISVLGLNPHAGESGHLGREEIDVITPVIEQLQSEGLAIDGPFPADSAFTPHFLSTTDVIVAMYHDQGLPVIKYAGFGNAVNVTLGLPIVRTSVDHGTALALARTGKADPGSLRAALRLAAEFTSASTPDAGS